MILIEHIPVAIQVMEHFLELGSIIVQYSDV